jgi:hypothetical protein
MVVPKLFQVPAPPSSQPDLELGEQASYGLQVRGSHFPYSMSATRPVRRFEPRFQKLYFSAN